MKGEKGMKKLYDAPAVFILPCGQDAICSSFDVLDVEGVWKWGDGELS